MTSWNVWLGPLLSLIEIGLLLGTIYLTVSQFRRSRASTYIERFNSSDALANRVAVDQWLQEHKTPKARLVALEADARLRNHLRQFANLFQELGAAYQFRVAHRKTVRVLFDALVVMYWEELRFWVYDYRAVSDPTLYARFEYLYDEVRRYAKKDRRPTMYVVAYGSLMGVESLGAALGRDVALDELLPVTLTDIRRQWSVSEQVRIEAEEHARAAAFLDVTEDVGSTTAAAIVRVSEGELERLDRREKNYDRRDIGQCVRLTGDRRLEPKAMAWCYFGKEEHQVDSSQSDVVILERYLSRVVLASRDIDPAMEVELRAAAQNSGFSQLTGDYVFVDSAQAALV
jgi:hypothetical protein